MNKEIFFKLYRDLLDKNQKLTQDEVNAIDFFLNKVIEYKTYFTLTQWAYVFATVFHETAFTFKPVKEAFHLSENWRRRNLRYFPFYGRGYVQLTWEYNYKRYSKILGIDLINQPELCIDPDIAFRILIHGMKKGVFTGKGIGRYINRFRKNYKYARYVINGRDKRNTIAGYASSFEFILQKSF